MAGIAATAVFVSGSIVRRAPNVTVMDYVVIGAPNVWRKRLTAAQRRVDLGDGVTIYPHSVVFEGATLKRAVVMEERTSVGSGTTIGERSCIIYQSQVNDRVSIGADCKIGGFIGDNTRIGDKCSIFGDLVHLYSNHDTRRWGNNEEEGPTLESKVVVGWGAVILGPVHIGSGALIGVNSTLVGPLRIGKNAVVGPNQVIRYDLAEGGRI
jgi:UDP-3-O-[3-hydroxymyristoyl] glucosamine N-acyltransferase